MALSSSYNQVGPTGNSTASKGFLTAPTSSGQNFATPPAKPLSVATLPQPQPGVMKKQVVKTAGGDTHEIHYDTKSTPSGGTVQNINGGQVYSNPSDNPDYKPQPGILNTSTQSTPTQSSTAPTAPTTASPAPTQSTYTAQDGRTYDNNQNLTYGGLIGQGASASKTAADAGANNYNTSNQGLLNAAGNNQQYADRAKEIADAAGQKISDLGQQGAGGAGFNNTGLNTFALGAGAQVENTIAAKQKAITDAANMQLSGNQQGLTANSQTQSGYNSASGNALSSQGQGISGLGSNAGFLAPVTTPALFNPTTGQPINPELLGSAIQTANNLVNNGTPITDPTVQALLSPYGFVGTQALVNAQQAASGGGFNPAAQSATANQNISQSTQYQGAATDLDTGLKQLGNISNLATNFLNTNKLLNPSDNPDYNAGINTYVGKFKNPADKLNYEMIMGDIAKFQSQILASNNGQIPTAITNQLANFDPHNLSASQLLPYLQTLDQLGKNQLSVLQGQSTSSLGNKGAYSGTPASVSTVPISSPNETANNNLLKTSRGSDIEAAIGTAMNFAGGLWNGITGLASHLFGK